jgi:RNA polymerase sigma-70 factor (ECF subfamily)
VFFAVAQYLCAITQTKLTQIERLFKQHHSALHWFCMQYVHSTEDANEIVNDAFLAVWEKQNELDLDDSLKSYLYTIVRNKSLNLLKKRKLEITELDMGFEIPSLTHSPIEILQAKQTEALVMNLIEQLPPRCKQIFVLSRKEQLSNKEIAELMELNEKTIENQISIAIKFIKNGLSKKQSENKLPLILFPWVLAMLLN